MADELRDNDKTIVQIGGKHIRPDEAAADDAFTEDLPVVEPAEVAEDAPDMLDDAAEEAAESEEATEEASATEGVEAQPLSGANYALFVFLAGLAALIGFSKRGDE